MTTKQPNPGQTSRVLHTNDPADHGNGERMKEARARLDAIELKVSSLDEATRNDLKADIDALRQAL